MASREQIRRRGRWSLIIGTVLAALTLGAVMAHADNVINTVDTSVDATKEAMSLTAGGATGSTYVWVQNVNTGGGDTENACNLAGSASLSVNVQSTNTAVATVSPSAVTIDECSDGNTTSATELAKMRQIIVTPVSSGSADITFSLNSFNGSGTFNYSTATFTANVTAPPDATPPIITPNVSGTLGNGGWYTSNVTVSWTVTDNESSISSSSDCGSTTITTDTTGTTLTCTATSGGGTNSASVTIKRDATAPTISRNTSADSCDVPGSSGWCRGTQTTGFTATDATSGISPSGDPSVNFTQSTSTNGSSVSIASGAVSDVAGNTNSGINATGFQIDSVAPSVVRNTSADSCSLSGDNGWCRGTQSAGFTATDATSGVAPSGGPSVNFTQSTATNGSNVSIASGAVSDVAGNTNNGINATGFKIDSVAPAVACQSPAPSFLLNQPSATVTATVTDATSGPVNVTEVAQADTSAVGSKTVQIIATDTAGNTSTPASCAYFVGYVFEGLFAPIDRPNTMNVTKAGQTIPLKWRLTDYFGNGVTSLNSVTVTVSSISCQFGAGTTDEVEEYASGSSGLQNLGDGYYQFNWKTPTSYAGSCKSLNLSLGEGTARTGLALISFKK